MIMIIIQDFKSTFEKVEPNQQKYESSREEGYGETLREVKKIYKFV